jgi:hypothetical protein
MDPVQPEIRGYGHATSWHWSHADLRGVEWRTHAREIHREAESHKVRHLQGFGP